MFSAFSFIGGGGGFIPSGSGSDLLVKWVASSGLTLSGTDVIEWAADYVSGSIPAEQYTFKLTGSNGDIAFDSPIYVSASSDFNNQPIVSFPVGPTSSLYTDANMFTNLTSTTSVGLSGNQYWSVVLMYQPLLSGSTGGDEDVYPFAAMTLDNTGTDYGNTAQSILGISTNIPSSDRVYDVFTNISESAFDLGRRLVGDEQISGSANMVVFNINQNGITDSKWGKGYQNGEVDMFPTTSSFTMIPPTNNAFGAYFGQSGQPIAGARNMPMNVAEIWIYKRQLSIREIRSLQSYFDSTYI